MRQTPFALLVGSMIMAALPALAQTTTPSPGTGAATNGGGITDWWWVLLLVVVIAAAIWYFMDRGRRSRI
jgi:hypothetical protein